MAVQTVISGASEAELVDVHGLSTEICVSRNLYFTQGILYGFCWDLLLGSGVMGLADLVGV